MGKAREKAQGYTKQLVGEMIGDDLLVREGKEQEHIATQEAEPQDAAPTGKPRRSKRRDA